MLNVRLIATDLDGTVIGRPDDYAHYAEFRDIINEARLKNNAVWAVCTGRSLKSFQRISVPLRMIGIMPNFVIIKHAYIYSLSDLGYIPHIFWNLQIRFRLWINEFRDRRTIGKWHHICRRNCPDLRSVRREKDRLRMHFNSDVSAAFAANMFAEMMTLRGHLRMFKYLQEIDIRKVPFSKGLALSELAHRLKISPDRIMAIGDGHNDISMLDGDIAKFTGCPANSAAEVIHTVHISSGHIARKDSLAGVIEILNAYSTGNVRSDLPADWRDPSYEENPQGRSSHRSGSDTRWGINVVLFLAAAYAVLLAFANFNVLPFSDLIIKPFHLLIGLMEKLFSS